MAHLEWNLPGGARYVCQRLCDARVASQDRPGLKERRARPFHRGGWTPPNQAMGAQVQAASEEAVHHGR